MMPVTWKGTPDVLAPHLVIDGREDSRGRALFGISALHLCAPALGSRRVVVVDVARVEVEVAAEAFGFDTGLEVECRPPDDPRDSFAGAALYAAVAFRDLGHLRRAEARRHLVPTLFAIQFPARPDSRVEPARIAHDTRAFADRIASALQDGLRGAHA